MGTNLVAKNKSSKRLKTVKKKASEKKEQIKGKAKDYVSGEDQALNENPEKITSLTVKKTRREVLEGARRFVYPVSHAKHKVAIISAAIVTVVIIAFLAVSTLMLYRYQSTSTLAYRMTQILPFPVARVDGDFVRYEEYLFELRSNTHFYSTQEAIDFNDFEGERILTNLKQEALDRAKSNTVIRKLAEERGVTVTDAEIDAQIELIRSRGGAGQSLESLENTLEEFYDWSLNDWRRVLEIQLLKQKLTPVLDPETRDEANAVLGRVNDGESFSKLAAEFSDDELTRDEDGEIGIIARSNVDLPARFIEEAFMLGKGQNSGLVETTFEVSATGDNVVAIHIIKNIDNISDEEMRAAHILFIYNDINLFVDNYMQTVDMSEYIDLPELEELEDVESGEQVLN